MTRPRAVRRFHQELEGVRAQLMEMAGLAENLVLRGVQAFLTRDADAFDGIRRDDERIDTLELTLDDRVLELLALHQPVASDLRQLFATVKISKDLERVGDHATNIAGASRHLPGTAALPEIPEFAELVDLSQRMLQDALASYGTRDSELAREVCTRDDRVDDMERTVQDILVALMVDDPRRVHPALQYLRVAQQLERIADLSTNISEDVVFLVEGSIIKHHAETRGNRAPETGGALGTGAAPGTDPVPPSPPSPE